MTEDEAYKVAKILTQSHQECSECVNDLLKLAETTLPGHNWSALVDRAFAELDVIKAEWCKDDTNSWHYLDRFLPPEQLDEHAPGNQ